MAYVDCHTHTLPGLDDGPSTMEESLALARALVKAGFTRAAATPHADTAASRSAILSRLAELKEALVQSRIPLEIYPGAEYTLEPGLAERLDAGSLLTLNGSRFLLLETPDFQPLPPYLGELIFQLRLRGCYPVLAHPERCGAFQQDPGRLYQLIRAGALTQVTLSSLTGAMGPAPAHASARFFAARAVHLLATDAHNAAGRLSETGPALALVEKLGGAGAADLMLKERPGAILEDRLPPLPEPQEESKTKRTSCGFFKGRRTGHITDQTQ